MALADVCRAVGLEMIARGVPIDTFFGQEYLHDRTGGYVAVWVPSADNFLERNYQPTPTTQGLINPRSLKTRMAAATVTLKARPPELEQAGSQVAQDYAAMESLIDAFIASLHAVAAGTYVLTGGTYVNGQGAHVRAGINYELGIAVQIPVLDIPWPKVATTTPCVTTYGDAPAQAEITVEEQLDPPDYEPAITFVTPPTP